MARTNEQQDTDIDNLQSGLGDKVEMGTLLRILGFVIAGIVAVSGWTWAAIQSVDERAIQNTANISEVSGDIKAIKTDLRWFKEELNNNPQSLRKKFNQLSQDGR